MLELMEQLTVYSGAGSLTGAEGGVGGGDGGGESKGRRGVR